MDIRLCSLCENVVLGNDFRKCQKCKRVLCKECVSKLRKRSCPFCKHSRDQFIICGIHKTECNYYNSNLHIFMCEMCIKLYHLENQINYSIIPINSTKSNEIIEKYIKDANIFIGNIDNVILSLKKEKDLFNDHIEENILSMHDSMIEAKSFIDSSVAESDKNYSKVFEKYESL